MNELANELAVHAHDILSEEECRSLLHYLLELAGLEIDWRCYNVDELRDATEGAIKLHTKEKVW